MASHGGRRCLGSMSIKFIIIYALCFVHRSALMTEAFVPSHSKSHHAAVPSPRHKKSWHRGPTIAKQRINSTSHLLPPFPFDAQPSLTNHSDRALALCVCAFAASHIGMSAIRTAIIASLGEAANATFNLVGNEGWTLPNYWPGDNTGGNKIFPDELTVGDSRKKNTIKWANLRLAHKSHRGQNKRSKPTYAQVVAE